jgi:hypothetical protein
MNPQTPSSAPDPLAQLQDIHLPEAVGLWPPAWGWWLLLVVVIAAVASIIYFVRRNRSRNAYRALALKELAKIKQQYDANKNSEYLQAVSILLRRTALSGFSKQFNASIKGEEWLRWLDAQSGKPSTDFSQGVGRALLIGPYQKNPEFDRNALHKLVESWIQQHRNQWQKKSAPIPSVKNGSMKSEASANV